MQQPWTLPQLAESIRQDLPQCTSRLERDNCEAITRRQMRALAKEIEQSGRAFTPSEIRALQSQGII